MFDYTKLLGAGALSALLLATPALADFDDEWDADADGMFSEEEFGAGFGELGAYGKWDGDADGMLSEEEFGVGVGDRELGDFGEWDEDADGLLSEEEFDTGFFEAYDADADGFIGDAEIGDVGDDLGEAGLFDF